MSQFRNPRSVSSKIERLICQDVDLCLCWRIGDYASQFLWRMLRYYLQTEIHVICMKSWGHPQANHKSLNLCLACKSSSHWRSVQRKNLHLQCTVTHERRPSSWNLWKSNWNIWYWTFSMTSDCLWGSTQYIRETRLVLHWIRVQLKLSGSVYSQIPSGTRESVTNTSERWIWDIRI